MNSIIQAAALLQHTKISLLLSTGEERHWLHLWEAALLLWVIIIVQSTDIVFSLFTRIGDFVGMVWEL